MKKLTSFLLAMVVCLSLPANLSVSAVTASDDMGWGDVVLGAGTLDTDTPYDVNEMKKIAVQAGEEGIVMVKNENGALPLRSTDTVAVFGAAQFWESSTDTGGYHFGGIGSGAMWGRPDKTPIDAITAQATKGKFRVYPAISNKYKKNQSNYTPTAKDYADAKAAGVNKAIVFITRHDGESDKDLNPDGDEKIAPGDWYLSRKEESLIQALNEQFKHVIVVVNTGDVMDTGWIKRGIDGVQVVDAALFSWYGGTYGATALANVLSGDAAPSGKLAETAADIDNYPTTDGFNNAAYAAYTEDVFLGYRYFETFNVPVNYEFGFGLSYTTFGMSDIRMTSNATHITVKVTVKNTGSYAGKEVVQVYFSAPQKGTGSAKLSKPAKELAGYAKTDLLKPGQSQDVTVKFPISELASYDDTGVTQKAAWVIEAGDYKILVGNSVKNVKQAGIYNQPALKVVEQLETKLTPQALDKRMTWDGSGNVAYETLNTGTVKEPVLIADTSKGQQTYDRLITFDDLLGGEHTVEQLVSQMTIDELASFTVPTEQDGYPYGTPFGGSLAVSQKYGTPIVNTADGPAGINTYEWAFPSAITLACTWNLDILADFGTVTGKYAKSRSAYDFWLAPGVNMQRNPLGGRNYEYFSEDALVTGLCGTAIVAKCQALGLSVAVKHYIANDKEQARSSCDSRVSERAMREIYLRPFEFLAKIGKAASFMMGYNVVNGVQIHSYQELLELPRTDWGWTGMYMSDWGDLNCGVTQAYVAGSNVAMNAVPQNPAITDYSPMTKAYRDGKVNRTLLEQNAATVVRALFYHEKGVEYREVTHYDATGPIKSGAPNVTTKTDLITTATVGNGLTTVQAERTTDTDKPNPTATTKTGQTTTEGEDSGRVTDSAHTSADTSVNAPVGGTTGDIPNDQSSMTTVLTNADGTPVPTTVTKVDGVSEITATNVDGTPIVPTTTGAESGNRPTDTKGDADNRLWLYAIVGAVVVSGVATLVLLAIKNKKATDAQDLFKE